MTTQPHVLATASVEYPVSPKYSTGPDDMLTERFAVNHYSDVVELEIEHYDARLTIQLDLEGWRALRAEIIENGDISD
jgi:hypothetical protein